MRDRCIVCGARLLNPALYICKNMPNEAQMLPDIHELEKDKPIEYGVFQCSGCGLVQLNCEPVSYYKDSTRAGERCAALIELRQQQYSYFIEKYDLAEKKIIEIGAGKGGFLKTLAEMESYNIDARGIENNNAFVEIARKQEGVNVFQGFLDGEDYLIPGRPYDAFVSFAYPARLPDPNSMFRSICNNLVEGGVGFVQVPSLEHLLEHGGFFDITRDHIAYYDERTLRFVLENNGFEVLEQGEVSQIYIYAIVRKKNVVPLAEKWNDVDALLNEFVDYIDNARNANKKIAVWCAGHFAFTVLSVACLNADEILYIIDNAKFKQNRFSPASHIPIVAPDYLIKEPVDLILILGPIYIDEIVKEINAICTYDVQIATMDLDGIKECN